MAIIYRIEQTGQRSSGGRSAAGTSAEIIIFPGVRYERWIEGAEPASGHRRERTKRDRLEIAE